MHPFFPLTQGIKYLKLRILINLEVYCLISKKIENFIDVLLLRISNSIVRYHTLYHFNPLKFFSELFFGSPRVLSW